MSEAYPRIMLVRQRLGIIIMIFFLPINGPLLRWGFEELSGSPLPFGDFYFFTLCVLMFLSGGVMTFTPKLKFPSQE